MIILMSAFLYVMCRCHTGVQVAEEVTVALCYVLAKLDSIHTETVWKSFFDFLKKNDYRNRRFYTMRKQ